MFASKGIAARYSRKFHKKVEAIRHSQEVKLIKPHVSGAVVDMSVGSGRFIKEMDYLSYTACDYSSELLDYVSSIHPEVETFNINLESKLPFEDCYYDTVMCIRTLTHIHDVRNALAEISRIVKPRGYIIFDYATEQKWEADLEIEAAHADIEALLNDLPVKVRTIHMLDGMLHKIKVKESLNKFSRTPVNMR